MLLTNIQYTTLPFSYNQMGNAADTSKKVEHTNNGPIQTTPIIQKNFREPLFRSVLWTQKSKDRFKELSDNGTPLRQIAKILTDQFSNPFTFRDVSFYKNKLTRLIPPHQENKIIISISKKTFGKHITWTLDEKKACQELLDQRKSQATNNRHITYRDIAEILTEKFQLQFTESMVQYYSDRYACYQGAKHAKESENKNNVYTIPAQHPVWKSIKLSKSYTSREKRLISPLSYVGNKNSLTPLLWNLLPDAVLQNKVTVVSPFAGSMAFELTLAMKNIQVIAGDAFKELCNFWKCLFENKIKLAQNVQDWTKQNPDLIQSQEKYNALRKLCTTLLKDPHPSDSNRFLSATYFFILNKLSMNSLGLATASGLSKSRLEEFSRSEPEAPIKTFKNMIWEKLSIEEIDYKQLIERNPAAFLFLDPPYWYNTPRENRLYGVDGELHKNFSHKELHNILKKRNSWILCYNDCPNIRDLYKEFTTLQIPCKDTQRMSELLILSHDIANERKQGIEKLTKRI